MKSFLLREDTKKPIIRWGQIPDGTFFEGEIPSGFSLAICPNNPYVILDIDVKNGKNGWLAIPNHLQDELKLHFNYKTKSGGSHVWMLYTGSKKLKNMASTVGCDLRVGGKGYVRWYLSGDVREHLHKIQKTSFQMNKFLEELFS